MWSEGYRFFYEILKHSKWDNEFDLRPIEIPQSRFDEELYQNKEQHFWYGSFIKVDTIIDCLEKATESYIIFSDIDVLIRPGLYIQCVPFMEDNYDMVFLREGQHYNIGFMLFRVCPEVINFWKGIRLSMVEHMDLDQNYVNKNLPEFSGKVGHFDKKYVLNNNDWDGSNHNWKFIQILCSCISKEFNMAEKIFSMAQFIDLQPYMKFVDPNIIPYIYKFQEILIESHKRAKAGETSG
jgi:hypothetical protein